MCGVSGGIDSTVTALLIHRAVKNRLKCIFVDNGLLRLNETKEIQDMFTKNFKVDFTKIDAQKQFLSKLKGVDDPEKKERLLERNLLGFLRNLLRVKVSLLGLLRELFILT